MGESLGLLVKKERKDCPYCETEHEVEVYKRKGTAMIKGEEVNHNEEYTYCPTEEEGFFTKEQMDYSLKHARAAYQRLHKK